jgi:hypothetical protein
MPRCFLGLALASSAVVACAKDTRRADAQQGAPAESAAASAAPPSEARADRPLAPSGDAAAPAPKGREACRVKFSGAEESEFVGKWYPLRKDDSVTAASDYWATEAEMRTALRAGIGAGDRAEAERQIDQRMQNDPRVVILELHCMSDGGAVVIVSSAASKYGDVPFKTGSYKLGTGTMKSAPAGDFVVARLRSATTPYTGVKPGTLNLTKFDATGVAGSFSFGAQSVSTKTPAKIEGTFDLPCEPNRFGQCQLGG